MSKQMQDGMAEATRLTREGRLSEATALIQRSLEGFGVSHLGDSFTFAPQSGPGSEAPSPTPAPRVAPSRSGAKSPTLRLPPKPSRPPGRHRFTPPTSTPGNAPDPASAAGGRFLSRSYTGRSGTRAYKLYVPSGYTGQAVPLIVMLHGCTQNPDDFASGTRLNALAEEHTFLAVYPEQPQNANMSRCWNWFKEADQQRDRGEPAIIAGITREVREGYGTSGGQVYVAGMSAGGAMAAILGTAYPDLYAAVGVHSGLAPGAARDLPSALSAMQRGGVGKSAPDRQATRTVPVIAFHGDRDTTVHPANAEHLLAHYGSTSGTIAEAIPTATARQGQVPGGYAYTRHTRPDTEGRTIMERWTVHGLGHAWSGGSGSGSYTDPKGPDATAEMVRFFEQHRRPVAAGDPTG